MSKFLLNDQCTGTFLGKTYTRRRRLHITALSDMPHLNSNLPWRVLIVQLHKWAYDLPLQDNSFHSQGHACGVQSMSGLSPTQESIRRCIIRRVNLNQYVKE